MNRLRPNQSRSRDYNGSFEILRKDWTILHYYISFGSAKDVSNLLSRDDFQPCLKTGTFLPLLFLPECPESAQKKTLIKKYLLKKNFDIRKVFQTRALRQPTQMNTRTSPTQKQNQGKLPKWSGRFSFATTHAQKLAWVNHFNEPNNFSGFSFVLKYDWHHSYRWR